MGKDVKILQTLGRLPIYQRKERLILCGKVAVHFDEPHLSNYYSVHSAISSCFGSSAFSTNH